MSTSLWPFPIAARRIPRLICAGVVLGAAPALAAGGFYLGGGMGLSYGSFDGDDFSSGAVQQSFNQALVDAGLPSGLVVASSDLSEDDVGWKLFAGYRFNDYLGIEGSYANFGTFRANYSGTYLGAPVSGSVRYKADSWNLIGVLRYPIADFSLQAKLGAAFTHATNELTLSAGTTSEGAEESESKTNFLWGLGVGYNITDQLWLLAEYENYGKVGAADSTGRVDVSLWSVSLLFGF